MLRMPTKTGYNSTFTRVPLGIFEQKIKQVSQNTRFRVISIRRDKAASHSRPEGLDCPSLCPVHEQAEQFCLSAQPLCPPPVGRGWRRKGMNGISRNHARTALISIKRYFVKLEDWINPVSGVILCVMVWERTILTEFCKSLVCWRLSHCIRSVETGRCARQKPLKGCKTFADVNVQFVTRRFASHCKHFHCSDTTVSLLASKKVIVLDCINTL